MTAYFSYRKVSLTYMYWQDRQDCQVPVSSRLNKNTVIKSKSVSLTLFQISWFRLQTRIFELKMADLILEFIHLESFQVKEAKDF